MTFVSCPGGRERSSRVRRLVNTCPRSHALQFPGAQVARRGARPGRGDPRRSMTATDWARAQLPRRCRACRISTGSCWVTEYIGQTRLSAEEHRTVSLRPGEAIERCSVARRNRRRSCARGSGRGTGGRAPCASGSDRRSCPPLTRFEPRCREAASRWLGGPSPVPDEKKCRCLNPTSWMPRIERPCVGPGRGGVSVNEAFVCKNSPSLRENAHASASYGMVRAG